MIYKYQYTDSNSRQDIINANKDKYLIEEQNIKDGNFLIFSDTPRPEEEFQIIKQKQELMQKAIDGLILGGVS